MRIGSQRLNPIARATRVQVHRRRTCLPARPRITDQLLERDRHLRMISRPEVAVERTLNHPKNPGFNPPAHGPVHEPSASRRPEWGAVRFSIDLAGVNSSSLGETPQSATKEKRHRPS